MKYEWDSKKAKTNLRKHDIDFADAVGVFEDIYAIGVEDRDHEEERFVIMGMDFLNRIITVTYTYRGQNIRIISARKATIKEKREYIKKFEGWYV